VTPTGEIVAIDLRGSWMGNRGCIHDAPGHIAREWRSKAWITCELSHKDWVAPRWEPGRWTALFFHDEAVALAAGHRPCALCRRPAYNAFLEAWVEAFDGIRPRAPEVDAWLHAERLGPRRRRKIGEVTDGAFIAGPALVWHGRLHPWSASGYGPPVALPRGDVEVITPPSILEVLRAGYVPQVAV
jgi:hypothetical protein